jgi:hypothetical protein
MQDFAPFIPEFLGALSRPPAVKGAEPFARINLPATFQFSPATSKSIDIPGIDHKMFLAAYIYIYIL